MLRRITLRKSTNKYSLVKRFLCLLTLCGLASTSLTGCGKGEQTNADSKPTQVAEGSKVDQESNVDETPQSNEPKTTQVSQTKIVDTPAAKPAAQEKGLKGVWYGEAVYDVDAVNARLAQLAPEQAAQLEEKVNTFSTIVMACEFRPDSALEFDMMITTPDGQQLRDRSIGTWKIVQKNQTSVTIETSEYKNEEQEATAKVYVYQFIDNDHFQFVPDSISPDLRSFSPRIVFQRVEQELDDAAVAEEQNGNVVR